MGNCINAVLSSADNLQNERKASIIVGNMTVLVQYKNIAPQNQATK